MSEHITTRLPLVISGEGVVLHAWRPQLAEELFEAIDADRQRLTRAGHWVSEVHDAEAMRTRLARNQQRRAEGLAAGYLIRSLEVEGQPLVGSVGIFHVVEADRRCEIGYWVLGLYEGRGLITASVRALSTACFCANMHRIELCCSADNPRSSAVAERCGFSREGRLRDAHRQGDRWSDDLLYSRLSTDP